MVKVTTRSRITKGLKEKVKEVAREEIQRRGGFATFNEVIDAVERAQGFSVSWQTCLYCIGELLREGYEIK